jgi:hypothetical protein
MNFNLEKKIFFLKFYFIFRILFRIIILGFPFRLDLKYLRWDIQQINCQ